MRFSTSARRTTLRRALALSTAAGMIALTGPVLPAAAQGSSGEPPRLDPSQDAGTSPLSPKNYEQQQQCMQANTSSSMITQKPWSQLTLGYEQAHAQGVTGGNQTVAVIDTGVNQHPLLPNVIDGSSSVPDGGATRDCDGHGTAVAGIIAAQQTPKTGYVGVAPDTDILSIRQSSKLWKDKQSGQVIGDTHTMAQSINLAVARGAQVINISQSSCQAIAEASQYGETYNQELHNAVKNAVDANRVVVAAAGNVEGQCQKNPPGSPTTAVLPAWFDEYVLTVASTNQQGAPSEFTVPGPWVDVAAPGENLIALDPGVTPGGGPATGLASQISTGEQGQPGPINGTSYAAPYVTGLVALIKQKHNHLTPQQIMDRVKKTALHPGGSQGRNDIVGYGMVDPMAALNDVVPAEYGQAAPPVGPQPLDSDVIPKRDWPAIMIAFGGAGSGIAAILFTAFLANAVRNVRARQSGDAPEERR